jgi:hypothetical protein
MVAGLRRGRQVVSSVIGEGIPRVHHVGRSARSFGIFPNRKFSEVFAPSSIARLRWQAALQPKAPLCSPIALSLVDSSSAWSARLGGARSSYAIALPSSNRPPVGPSGGNRTPHRTLAAPCSTDRGALGPPRPPWYFVHKPEAEGEVRRMAGLEHRLDRLRRHPAAEARPATSGRLLGQSLSGDVAAGGPTTQRSTPKTRCGSTRFGSTKSA